MNFFRQVRNDPVIRVFAILFIVVHVPYFLPSFSREQLSTYYWSISAIFHLPFTAIVLLPRRRDPFPDSERSFWRVLSVAFALWWIVSLISWLWPDDLWSSSVLIGTDALFLGFYVAFFVSLSFSPHSRSDQDFERSDLRLLAAAAIVLAFSLFSYFILLHPDINANHTRHLCCLDSVPPLLCQPRYHSDPFAGSLVS